MIARYSIPAICWSMTRERAWGVMGRMSDNPVDVIVVQDRNNSSNHVRGALGSMVAMKLPGTSVWQNQYR